MKMGRLPVRFAIEAHVMIGYQRLTIHGIWLITRGFLEGLHADRESGSNRWM